MLPLAAQLENSIWYFGKGAGISLQGDVPKVLTDGQTDAEEETAIVCDSLGNLLFYTDGRSVWDRNHTVMANGTGLKGHTSGTSSLIVQKPGCDSMYYIFTTGILVLGGELNYSMVNIRANGGLGEIILKNVFLSENGNESVTATKHENGTDVWIVAGKHNVHSRWQSFLLTEDGVVHTPIVYKTPVIYKPEMVAVSAGHLVFSLGGESAFFTGYYQSTPDGESKRGVFVFDFDKQTGQFTYKTTCNSDNTLLNLELSPSGKFIFFIESVNNGLSSTRLLTRYVLDDVISNNQLKDINADTLMVNRALIRAKMGVDHRLYVISGIERDFVSYVDFVEFEKSKIVCHHQGLSLLGGKAVRGLPTTSIVNRPSSYKFSIVVDTLCVGNQSVINVNSSCDSIHWHINGEEFTSFDSSTQYTPSTSGSVVIEAQIFRGNKVFYATDSVASLRMDKPNLGRDTLLCNNESITLEVDQMNLQRVIWSIGSNLYEIDVDIADRGDIWVQVSDIHCAMSDTLKVEFIDCGLLADSFCLGNGSLFELAEQQLDSVHWQFGDGVSVSGHRLEEHLYTTGGIFEVEATAYKLGLTKVLKSEIYITEVPKDFLPDSTYIGCEATLITPFVTGPYDYLWQNGGTSQSLLVSYSGEYSLVISENGCSASDRTYVDMKECNCVVFVPTAFSPNADGLNDVFYPITDCEIKNARLSIYNMWGEKIFDRIDSGWDGMYEGNLSQNGTYLWMLNYLDHNGSPIYQSGSVNLIR